MSAGDPLLPSMTLAPGHPAVGALRCAACGELFAAGEEVMLVAVGTESEEDRARRDAGRPYTTRAVMVHWRCRPGRLGGEDDGEPIADVLIRHAVELGLGVGQAGEVLAALMDGFVALAKAHGLSESQVAEGLALVWAGMEKAVADGPG